MKKEYIEPSINTIRIDKPLMQALSGGDFGDNGDAAESRKYKGRVFEDEEPVNTKWYNDTYF